jgi:hypothetical protein
MRLAKKYRNSSIIAISPLIKVNPLESLKNSRPEAYRIPSITGPSNKIKSPYYLIKALFRGSLKNSSLGANNRRNTVHFL